MLDVVTLGLFAGLLQAGGYLMYYILVIRREGKEAEPLTWLMFAYGTALLTVMELDSMWTSAARDPNWLNMLSILFVPIVCSLCGIGVALAIWRENSLNDSVFWPRRWRITWNSIDGKAFSADLSLTFIYILLWMVTVFGGLDPEIHLWWVLAFLVVSNLTTFPNFIPIIRFTAKHPSKEDWRPWAV